MRIHNIYPEEFPEPWASDWGEDEYGLWMSLTYKGMRQLFRWIEPGSFLMGSPSNEAERDDDEQQHTVTLSKGYWLAESSVTQALWEAVLRENPSAFRGEERPVENVSWEDTQRFIAKMNDMKPALKLVLPSEAQWEYACRAGTTAPFYFGEQITANLVNFDGTRPYNKGNASQFRQETVEVKSLPPNAWGLYEMHGNVREWCQDWFSEYPANAVTDPQGPDTGDHRLLRGGSWFYYGRNCRSACRYSYRPDLRSNSFGFRLARGY